MMNKKLDKIISLLEDIKQLLINNNTINIPTSIITSSTVCPYCGHVFEPENEISDVCICPNCGRNLVLRITSTNDIESIEG
jgi:rRNA maturation endonuclease Nob1